MVNASQSCAGRAGGSDIQVVYFKAGDDDPAFDQRFDDEIAPPARIDGAPAEPCRIAAEKRVSDEERAVRPDRLVRVLDRLRHSLIAVD